MSPSPRSKGLALGWMVLALMAAPVTALAQPITISVGTVESEKRCTLYEESAGSSAMIATPYGFAAASSWRTWLVRDCVDNFASIRTSIEAALAASGKFVVKPSGGAYVVSGRISDVSGDDAPPAQAPNPGKDGYSVATTHMVVNMDVSVKDAAGRIVHGALLTKKIETSSDIKIDDLHSWNRQSGQVLYTTLQHQVALAVARKVAFQLVPLRVVSSDGRSIQVNYGAPLLELGSMLQATSPDGREAIRYSVTSAGGQSAIAQIDGDGNASKIAPGSTVILIEPEDPAANGRRLKRVELP